MLSNWLGRASPGAVPKKSKDEKASASEALNPSGSKKKSKDGISEKKKRKASNSVPHKAESAIDAPKQVFASSSAVRLASLVFGGSDEVQHVPTAFDKISGLSNCTEVKIVETNGFYVGDTEEGLLTSLSDSNELVGKFYTGKEKSNKRPLNTWIQTKDGKVFIDWKGNRHTGQDAFRMSIAGKKGKKKDKGAGEQPNPDTTMDLVDSSGISVREGNANHHDDDEDEVICIDIDASQEPPAVEKPRRKTHAENTSYNEHNSKNKSNGNGNSVGNGNGNGSTKKGPPAKRPSTSHARKRSRPISSVQAVELQQALVQTAELSLDFFAGDQGYAV